MTLSPCVDHGSSDGDSSNGECLNGEGVSINGSNPKMVVGQLITINDLRGDNKQQIHRENWLVTPGLPRSGV